MKIVIVQGAFLPVPPVLGGAVEKRWFAMSKKFADKGHEVIHISRIFPGLEKAEMLSKVSHTRVKGFNTPKSPILLKIMDFIYTFRVLRRIPNDADIIVSNTFWLPILLSNRQKKKCVVDVARMPKGQMKFYRGVARFRGNSTPVVNAIKSEISKIYHPKVFKIPNPLPFVPSSEVDFSYKELIILFVGRIHPEKGLSILINAFSSFSTNGWKLQIIGPHSIESGGGGDSYLSELKKITKGNKNIEFVGPVYDTDQLNGYYKKASLFVYPSIAEMGETFGLAPLEAMAWGCVPIVSDLLPFKDFIINNENGFIFDHRKPMPEAELHNALIKAHTEVFENQNIRNKVLEVRTTHSIDVISDNFLEEFKSINLP